MTYLPPPSKQLVNQVRAHFISQGTSLSAWCREHGHYPSNVRQALQGTWDGPKGRALRTQLCKEAGLMQTRKAA